MTFEELLGSNLLHIGFAVGALAYLLRDILWLRLVAAASYGIFAVATLGRGSDAIWQFMPWYGAFIAINVVQAAIIAYQRWLWRFTPEEAELHAIAFPSLSRIAAKRLMKRGKWQTLGVGDALTTQGEFANRVFLLASGRVEVTLDGNPIVDLNPGQFIGEVGFIARSPASATAIAVADDENPTRVLYWDSEKLRRDLRRDDGLRSTLESALGTDLARKLADRNVSVRRQSGTSLEQPA